MLNWDIITYRKAKQYMKIGIIGGHLTPALAVIEALPKSAEVVYFGRKYAMEGDSAVSLEYQAMHARGVHFVEFTTGRLQRAFTRHTVASLRKIPQGFSHASYVLKQENVDVIVGFGGYLSVPLCLSAKMLGIPVIIHEQTLGAGLANRVIAPFADTICLSWNESKRFFPGDKAVVIGNPLVMPVLKRPSLFVGYRRSRPLITIVGGSQGAHVVNIAVEHCLESLLENYDIIHQTGDAKQYHDYDRLAEKRLTLSKAMQERYMVEKFIDPSEIESIYTVADLVIGRAGINTVTNLLLLNKPALLIPIVVGQKHEQLTNAQMFVKTGLGEILEQDELTDENFLRQITHMMDRIGNYSNKELVPMKDLHTNATKRLCDLILVYGRNK